MAPARAGSISQAQAARKAGLVVGFYHFLRAGNVQAQAAYFVEKAASQEYDLLACDWETGPDGKAPSCAEKDAFIREVQRLRGSTHRVLLYCNRDFWLNRDTTSFAGDGLWIAEYNGKPGKPSITAPWLIHQYTSTPVDTNVAAFDSRAALRTWAEKGTKTTTPTPSNPPKESSTVAKKSKTYSEVWDTDAAQPPDTSTTLKTNPSWAPINFLREIYDGITHLRADIAALRTDLKKKD